MSRSEDSPSQELPPAVVMAVEAVAMAQIQSRRTRCLLAGLFTQDPGEAAALLDAADLTGSD